jgi:hypothetical protein
MNPKLVEEFSRAYSMDSYFTKRLAIEIPQSQRVLTPSHFQQGHNGLLYFIDTDWNTRLCVPKSQANFVLQWTHETASESAHARLRRFLVRLKELLFWPTMQQDSELYALTCDTCQKIKVDHLAKMGGLRPTHILARPFETVSLDLITGLPLSGEEQYMAILVIVDKLTKFAVIIPTYNMLKQEGFTHLFVTRIVNVYGLPLQIITD